MSDQKNSILDSSYPVLLPVMPELHMEKAEFDATVKKSLELSQPRSLPLRVKPAHADRSPAARGRVGSAGRGMVSRHFPFRGGTRGRGRGRGILSLPRGGGSTPLRGFNSPSGTTSSMPRPPVNPCYPPGSFPPPWKEPHIPPGSAPMPPNFPFSWPLTPAQQTSPNPTSNNDGKSPANLAVETKNPFMTALLSHKSVVPGLDERDSKMLTENSDVAYKTSGEPLVDLFSELETIVSAGRLKEILDRAWENDHDATLKIIWNARSIHLGKSDRATFYRAVGWLAQRHPHTLLANLPWLVRPLITKKVSTGDTKTKKSNDAKIIDDDDEDWTNVEVDDRDGPPEQKKTKLDNDLEVAEFDIKYGVSHGYWKDLLNILVLDANDELTVDGDIRGVFNVRMQKTKGRKTRDWTAGRKKNQILERYLRTTANLEGDLFYRALHLTVARLFADQLRFDLECLKSGSKAEQAKISLAAKWAPSHGGMHDQHTYIVSSIAELLYPVETFDQSTTMDRTTYLKHARIAYQSKTLSPLRKHLQIVERPISEEKFSEIKYDRVPSQAMKQYTQLFAEKDFERFDAYIERVAAGKSKISGATLVPSQLVAETLKILGNRQTYSIRLRNRILKAKGTNLLLEDKMLQIRLKVFDGQWNTLVQRLRDSGTLENSIAVCDVSGSMTGPRFPDDTCPMDSSIGLSLLLAEITKPPFGGAFITFSRSPAIMEVGGKDDKRSFAEKISYIKRSSSGFNTDFVAVFEKLILPLAVKNRVKQEDMVKQIFVFSDMHFDAANGGKSDEWTSSYERIKENYEKHGYEMPRLIFWNLAGGRVPHSQPGLGNDSFAGGNGLRRHSASEIVAPKPVSAAEQGTALVSGYSQAQLKMFLDNGVFDAPSEEEKAEEVTIDMDENEEGHVVIEKKKEKKEATMDPLSTVRKAIGHPAYRMLKVVD